MKCPDCKKDHPWDDDKILDVFEGFADDLVLNGPNELVAVHVVGLKPDGAWLADGAVDDDFAACRLASALVASAVKLLKGVDDDLQGIAAAALTKIQSELERMAEGSS